MKIKHLKTQELAGMAAPYNPRRMSEHDLEALRRSLRFFGTVEPIVVNRRSGHIVGGHQRVKAAQAEGIDTLPVVHVDLEAEILRARDAGPAVVQEAVDRQVEAIVIGAPYRWHHGVFSLGHTAPYILRNAPCPVLLWRQEIGTNGKSENGPEGEAPKDL